MTEREKMIAGSVYDPSDDELIRLRQNAHRCQRETFGPINTLQPILTGAQSRPFKVELYC